MGVAVGALDYGTTYANEKKKGRTSAGAHLATAAKVGSGIAGGIVGGAFGSGVASLATGALGYSVARGATTNFIDTVFKPKNAPVGALPKKPKKRKPVTLNVSLDSKGKLTK